MPENKDVEGPYTVWENDGCEGWKPTSYSNLADALCTPRHVSEWEITKKVSFRVIEDSKIEIVS